MYFHVPSYLEDDFDDMLDNLGEDLSLNCDEATPTSFKGLITAMKFKANLKGLLDETKELFCSRSFDIKKGDYISDSNNNIYIISWSINTDINCKSTQVQICDYQFTFERFTAAVFDSAGTMATPVSYTTIVSSQNGFLSRITQGTFDQRENQVGVVGTQNIFIGIKYTENTANIKILDEFDFYNQRYEVIDIDLSQVNIFTGNDYGGILYLYARIKGCGKYES
jgi:hypothetical protein